MLIRFSFVLAKAHFELPTVVLTLTVTRLTFRTLVPVRVSMPVLSMPQSP